MHFASQQTTDGATQITVDGDLTIYHAAEIKQELLEAVKNHPVLELDLSNVGEIDSAGLQLLALAKRESRNRQQVMRIVKHSAAVRETIEFLNLVAYFGDPLLIPAGERA